MLWANNGLVCKWHFKHVHLLSCNQLDIACHNRLKETKMKATKVRKKAPKKHWTMSLDSKSLTKGHTKSAWRMAIPFFCHLLFAVKNLWLLPCKRLQYDCLPLSAEKQCTRLPGLQWSRNLDRLRLPKQRRRPMRHKLKHSNEHTKMPLHVTNRLDNVGELAHVGSVLYQIPCQIRRLWLNG